MTADEAYAWLMGEETSFDKHVLASILALSLSEGGAVAENAGYAGIPAVLEAFFPQAAAQLAGAETLARGDDEGCLLDLLIANVSSGSAYEMLLAGMLARRAQWPNHLWQDLGLRHRGELSALMTAHFAPLARRNRSDMKWKKFFFRTICRDGEYALCTAPSCGECCDFDHCFSEETGESLLAHLRRSNEQAV
ncbi:MAG: nitrogen fixation protein NifQ [Rhizomicrobium sp.]|nr:nitrogen fixation protein NifQ [Rhizomicrobium sp.]